MLTNSRAHASNDRGQGSERGGDRGAIIYVGHGQGRNGCPGSPVRYMAPLTACPVPSKPIRLPCAPLVP